MNRKPLVSIIMPLFNPNIEYLKESMKSILSQTHDKLELIIVFDEHDVVKDKLVFALFEEFNDDKRLKLIINQNKIGFTNSLNKGIKYSNGKYIGRMDGDDVSHEVRIHKQLQFLKRNKLDLVGCLSNVINENGDITGRLILPCNWKALRKNIIFHNPLIHSSILFKRKIIKEIGYYRPDFDLSEDYEFYLRAFSKGFRGANIPEYLHSLRIHSNSIIHSNNWRRNRLINLKCKFLAFRKYGYRRPYDFLFLAISPLSVFIPASKALNIKQLFGIINKTLINSN